MLISCLNLLKQYGELKILQNPKLRVLHSQPAIISVGTTFSYIKEVKTNITNWKHYRSYYLHYANFISV
jgi:type II secretory pathway component GspD/PulD (secretin)